MGTLGSTKKGTGTWKDRRTFLFLIDTWYDYGSQYIIIYSFWLIYCIPICYIYMCNLVMYVYIYMLYMTIPRFLTFPNLFFRLPLAPCGSRGWPLPSSTSQTMKVWDWSTLTRPLSSWNFRWNHPLFSEEMNNNERAGRKQKKTIGSSIFLSHFFPQLPSSRWCAQERKRPWAQRSWRTCGEAQPLNLQHELSGWSLIREPTTDLGQF